MLATRSNASKCGFDFSTEDVALAVVCTSPPRAPGSCCTRVRATSFLVSTASEILGPSAWLGA